MESLLQIFDNSIVGRYKTLERNIKSKSNSFYDSYLDLLENTFKRILDLEDYDYDKKYTCGTLLRESLVEDFFKNEVGIDDFTYNHCKDYIAKVNHHKHSNEKYINIETVITYMRVYHDVVSSYLTFKGKTAGPYDADYFNSIFGLTEKQNKELKVEVENLKQDLLFLIEEKKVSEEDITTYKQLLSAKELETMSLEDQNIELREQLNKLKDIKINAIEEKLDRTIDLLLELQDSVIENRISSSIVYRSITGKHITQEDIIKERNKRKTYGKK